MLQFTNHDYKNFHVNLRDDQLEVVITLTVTKDMVEFLSPNNVCKSPKRINYVLRTMVPISQMNESRVLSIANKLINSAMIHCREAKQKVLDRQIERIKIQSPRLTSNTLF